jgi:hypothetical protein
MTFHHVPLRIEYPVGPAFVQRRATVRYRCPPATLARLFIANSFASLTAWVQNLSQDGAGLLVGCPLEPETILTIELESPGQDLSLELQGRVVHATAQPDGNWAVG